MNRIIPSAAAAFVLFVAGQAHAQAIIDIAPEQRARIKQYVVKEQVRPSQLSERVTVGAAIPESVELRAVPSDWGPSAANYRYVYYDNQIVLVEPSSRKVVQIIE